MFRSVSPILLLLAVIFALFSTPASAERSFPQTGFTITNDKFLDYFDHRGGAKVLGYPLSKEFNFLGSRIQVFQRAVFQLAPDATVSLLSIADQGLFPYTRFDGSAFPAPDPELIQAAPSPNDPEYAAKAIDFVNANAPDGWQGMNTRFLATFMTTVTAGDAFPDGDGDPDLLPSINLEIWGLPTSRAAADPNDANIVYLRFQRGIMRFDNSTGQTRAVDVGNYLKTLMTGWRLPGDLAEEAKDSRLYLQYNNALANGLNRPADLPGTDLFAAFAPDDQVVPTPVPPTPTPVPPTPTPSVPTRPENVDIQGSEWFVDQTNSAFNLLPDSVRDYVFRVVEVPSNPHVELDNRTLYVTEASAFAPGWREFRDNQIEWYAGLIVHNATHIEQFVSGRPHRGPDAEREAILRQKALLQTIETTSNQKFSRYLTDVLNGGLPFSDWQQPVAP